MIIGIGTDIIEINRIEKAIEKNERFLTKNFTELELELFKNRNYSNETIAGNFASKEAISKCFGTGFRGFSLKDIEVLRDSLGKPVVNLSKNLKEQMKLNKYKIHLSISHNKTNAIAYAILENIN